MRKPAFNAYIFLIVIIAIMLGCKKNASSTTSFTATVGNDTYTFDSLFAWIDTSNLANNITAVEFGATNTKTHSLIALGGLSYPDGDVTGTYYYVLPLPNPLPNSYKYFQSTAIYLMTGADTGRFVLAGANVTNFTITKRTNTNLQGNFSLALNPEFANGTADESKTIYMNGGFTVPYKILP